MPLTRAPPRRLRSARGPRRPRAQPRGLGAQPGRRHGPPRNRGPGLSRGRGRAVTPGRLRSVPAPSGAVSLEAGAPPWARAPLPAPRAAPCPRPGLGRLGRISRRFLHPARALIEKLGGLAYLFSWNAAGYIFMAFSQQCRVSVSNSAGEEKSRRRPRPPAFAAPLLQIVTKCHRRQQRARPKTRGRVLLDPGKQRCAQLL